MTTNKLLLLCASVLLLRRSVVVAQDPAPDVRDPLYGLDSQIVTRRSVAKLTCEAAQMLVDLTFNEPFYGTILLENALPNDTSCRTTGTGATLYRISVPFKGCGTTQREVRVFENNMKIKFDNSSSRSSLLQLQSEERKTILCRQPPPVAPPVVNPLPPVIVVPGVPAPIVEQLPNNITEFTILIPLALVLVLGFCMCGLCCAWWWMKQRRALVERHRSIASDHGGSEITKLTGTTFPPIKIPRAVPPPSSSSSSRGSSASEAGLVRHLEGGAPAAASYASSSEESLSVHETYGYDQQQAAAQQQHMAITEYKHEYTAPPVVVLQYVESDRETLKNYTQYEREIVPPPQTHLHEADHESISVIESLENEIIVTATQQQQQKPKSPPAPRSPLPASVHTETQTMEYFDNTQRSFTHKSSQPPPPPPPPPMTTMTQSITTSAFNNYSAATRSTAAPSPPRPPPPPSSSTYHHHERDDYEQQRSSSTYNTMQHVDAPAPPLVYRSKPARPATLSTSSHHEQHQATSAVLRAESPSSPPSASTRYRVEQVLRVGAQQQRSGDEEAASTTDLDDDEQQRRRRRRPLDWNTALRLIETPHIVPISQRTTKFTTTTVNDYSAPSSPQSPSHRGDVVARDSTVFSRSMQARKREIEQFSSALSEDDATRLQHLMLHERDFKQRILACTSIGALLQLTRDTRYAHMFAHTAWQTIVRIFTRVLDLPRAATSSPQPLQFQRGKQPLPLSSPEHSPEVDDAGDVSYDDNTTQQHRRMHVATSTTAFKSRRTTTAQQQQQQRTNVVSSSSRRAEEEWQHTATAGGTDNSGDDDDIMASSAVVVPAVVESSDARSSYFRQHQHMAAASKTQQQQQRVMRR